MKLCHVVTFTFNLQLSCFDLQVCHVALAQVTLLG